MTSEVLAQVQSRRCKVKALHQWALPRAAGGGAGTVTAQLQSCLCVLSFSRWLYMCYRIKPIIHNEALRVFSNPDARALLPEGLCGCERNHFQKKTSKSSNSRIARLRAVTE